MLRNLKISTRIGLGSALVLVLAIGVITPTVLGIVKNVVAAAQERELTKLYDTVRASIRDKAQLSETVATLIANIPDAQQALAERDRERLAELFLPGYRLLHDDYDVRQMQYHLPPATSFFRVHKPEKFGDDLSGFRHTVVETNTAKEPVRGIEKGVAGIGIRGVVPVAYQGRHIGSAELGISFGQPFFDAFKEEYGVDVALRLKDNGGFKTFASTFGEQPLLSAGQLDDAVNGRAVIDEGEFKGAEVAVYGNVVEDYSGKPVGVIEIAMDRSYYAAAISDARNTTLGIGAIALLLGLGVSMLTARSITSPIRATAERMCDIAEGEGDLTRRLDDAGKDELSHLAQAFNQFVGKIQNLIQDVRGSTERLWESSRDMEGIVSETNRGINQQQSETEQVATAVNEMTATIQEVSRSASQAAEAANAADGKANDGHEVVNRTIRAINALAQEVNEAAGSMQTLEEDSKNIGAVLDVIRGIAEQTNLLALNAAIEAARAGEHGRGFAVVADEVRTLASRTQQSTEEIETMIETLQNAAVSTAKKMEEGRTRTEETVKQAQEAGDALEAIAGAVSVITDMNTQIASAAEEQSAVAEEINKNISNISHIAEMSAEGAHQTSTASDNIRGLAGELEGLVGRFKV